MFRLISLASFLSVSLLSFSQGYYVNLIWDQSCGTPTSPNPRMKTEVDPNGSLVVVGSQSNGSNADIYLSCIHPDGTMAWGQTCSSCPTADDWGEDIAIDDIGNIYICGVRHNGTDNDYFIAKYDYQGNLLWQQSYNNGGDDFAAAIALDATGDVYVTGTSQTAMPLLNSDIGTIKLSGNDGSILWTKLYDFVNLPEVGVDIDIDLSGDVIVCGASAQNALDTRFTVLKYAASNGNQLDIKRHNSPGNGYDLPSEMILNNNKVYVVGSSNMNTSNSDIKLLCLNDQLNVEWVQYYDKYGGEKDFGSAMAMTPNEEIAVTGYCENGLGGTEFMTLLYSSSGTPLWCQIKQGENELGYAEGKDVIVGSNGDILVTGFIEEDGLKKFRTAAIGIDGKVKWQKIFTTPQKDSRGGRLVAVGDDIIVTGDVSDNTQKTFTSVRYSARQRVHNFVLYQGKPAYLTNQLIVKFNPTVLNMAEVDNLNKEHWTLEEITSASFATKIRTTLTRSCGECPIVVYRIFRDLKSTDVSTINRLGKEVKIPEFWSVYVLEFPNGTDIFQVSNDLKTLFPDINYTTLNLLGETHAIATDPNYEDQRSMHYDYTGMYADSNHVNIEPAWDYTTGRRDIKIGVFEPGLFGWQHEDFGGIFSSQSKIDGWVLDLNIPMYDTTEFGGFGHPNLVCGTIGAIRNNDLGIAGVAGGNYENTSDLDSSGCALFGLSMGTTYDTVPVLMDYVAAAIVGSSIYNPSSDYGYGLHVMNNSWGLMPIDSAYFLDTNITLLRDAYHFANRQQVTVVASSGNFGDLQDTGAFVNAVLPAYPAAFDDDWIICVGGTGPDGNYLNHPDTTWDTFSATRGWNIDVAAPASYYLNYSTTAITVGSNDTYDSWTGTSASAPHVSGTSGLLISYLNGIGSVYDNLAPEDVEYILQATAVDKDTTLLPGIDSLTGYGLLNAGNALAYVDKYTRKLRHFGYTSTSSIAVTSLLSSGDTVKLSEIYQNDAGTWFQWNTPYVVNTYIVDITCSHNIPSSEVIVASWPRPSGSNTFGLFGSDNIVYPREKVDLIFVDNNAGTLKGYYYEVFDTLGNFIDWWPKNFSLDFEAEYSVLTQGNFATFDELEEANSISVYPNPTNGEQSIVLNLVQPMDVVIRLYNTEGRLIDIVYNGQLNNGQNIIDYNVSGLASGVYIYSVELENQGIKHFKIAKE